VERSSNKPVVGVFAAAVIVVVIIIGGMYAKEALSFVSGCSSTRSWQGVKAPTTMQCVCLYSLAAIRHSSDEVALIGALVANDQSALHALRRKHGDDWLPRTLVKVQFTMHKCIPQ